jgi:hypothetical protein
MTNKYVDGSCSSVEVPTVWSHAIGMGNAAREDA